MKPMMQNRYVGWMAIRPLDFGDEHFEPGDRIPQKHLEPMRDPEVLLRTKRIAAVAKDMNKVPRMLRKDVTDETEMRARILAPRLASQIGEITPGYTQPEVEETDMTEQTPEETVTETITETVTETVPVEDPNEGVMDPEPAPEAPAEPAPVEEDPAPTESPADPAPVEQETVTPEVPSEPAPAPVEAPADPAPTEAAPVEAAPVTEETAGDVVAPIEEPAADPAPPAEG